MYKIIAVISNIGNRTEWSTKKYYSGSNKARTIEDEKGKTWNEVSWLAQDRDLEQEEICQCLMLHPERRGLMMMNKASHIKWVACENIATRSISTPPGRDASPSQVTATSILSGSYQFAMTIYTPGWRVPL